jgi:hypothetical protein
MPTHQQLAIISSSFLTSSQASNLLGNYPLSHFQLYPSKRLLGLGILYNVPCLHTNANGCQMSYTGMNFNLGETIDQLRDMVYKFAQARNFAACGRN